MSHIITLGFLRNCKAVSFLVFLILISNYPTFGKKYNPIVEDHEVSNMPVGFNFTVSSNLLDPSLPFPNNNVWKDDVGYKKATGRVMLMLDNQMNECPSNSFEAKVEIQVTYFTFQSAQPIVKNQTLEVSYNNINGLSYNERAILQLPDAVYIKVQFVSINNVNFKNYLILRIEQEEERFFIGTFDLDHFSDPNTINVFDLDYNASENAIQLSMNIQNQIFKNSVEEFDIEWTFYDGYSDIPFDFRFNASRITSKTGSYSLVNNYESGFLIFRVRPVWYNGSDYKHRVEGMWSTCTASPSQTNGFYNDLETSLLSAMGNKTKFVKILSGIVGTNNSTAGGSKFISVPESNFGMNWQINQTYAEDAKRVDDISFFDGSLRARQQIASNPGDHNIIVTENIYDYEGKSSIQILPVPIQSRILNYIPNLNLNQAGSPYSYLDFDLKSSCFSEIGSLKETTGASQYYSENHPYIDLPGGEFQNYTPQAKGFPFIQQQFTQDMTGRVMFAGAAGSELRISHDNANNTHFTRFYYGVPIQEEIDMLFGTNVGYAGHYKKEVVVDPNGQFSISYKNAAGKVIATSLAGETPVALEALNGANNTIDITTSLLANDEEIQLVNNQFIVNKSIVIEKAGKVGFYYSLLPQNYMPKCSTETSGPCLDCVYDLEIRIQDNCGNNKLTDNDYPTIIKRKIGQNGDINNTCVTSNNFVLGNDPGLAALVESSGFYQGYITLNLTPGTYLISKKLSVSESTYQEYEKLFLSNGICKTFQNFETEEQTKISGENCEMTCTLCKTQLGTIQEYLLRKLGHSPSSLEITTYQEEYNEQFEDCEELCKMESQNPCELIKKLLIAEVSPYGKCFQIEQVTGTINFTWLNHSTNILQNVSIQTIFTGKNYTLTIDGINKNVSELSLNEFILYFKEDWAKELIPYHPEYCKYQQCLEQELSSDFDTKLLSVKTFDEALALGYLPTNFIDIQTIEHPLIGNNSDNGLDPYFTASNNNPSKNSIWAGLQSKMRNMTGESGFGLDAALIAFHNLYCQNLSSIGELQSCVNDHIDDIYGPNACAANKDYFWQTYRNLYLSIKLGFKNETNFYSTQCASYPSGYEQTIPNLDPIAMMGIGGKKESVLNHDGDVMIKQACDDQCKAYRPIWKEKLAGCPAADIESILDLLENICKNGCDANNMLGASTTIIPVNPNLYSFYDVLRKGIIGQSGNPKNLYVPGVCDDLLIPMPAPRGFEMLGEKKEIDLCRYKKITYSNTSCDQTDILETNEYVNCYCNSNNKSEAIKEFIIGQLQATQPELFAKSASTNYCPDCDALQLPLKDFFIRYQNELDGNTLQNSDVLLTNLLNKNLNLNKSYFEYLDFLSQCYGINKEDKPLDFLNTLKPYIVYNNFYKPSFYVGNATIRSSAGFYTTLGGYYAPRILGGSSSSIGSLFSDDELQNLGTVNSGTSTNIDHCACDKIFEAMSKFQTDHLPGENELSYFNRINSLNPGLTQAEFQMAYNLCLNVWKINSQDVIDYNPFEPPIGWINQGSTKTWESGSDGLLAVMGLGSAPILPASLLCIEPVFGPYPPNNCDKIKEKIRAILFDLNADGRVINGQNGKSIYDLYKDTILTSTLNAEILAATGLSFGNYDELESYFRDHCGCMGSLAQDAISGRKPSLLSPRGSNVLDLLIGNLYLQIQESTRCDERIDLFKIVDSWANSQYEKDYFAKTKLNLEILSLEFNEPQKSEILNAGSFKELLSFLLKTNYANGLLSFNCQVKRCGYGSGGASGGPFVEIKCCNNWKSNQPILNSIKAYINQLAITNVPGMRIGLNQLPSNSIVLKSRPLYTTFNSYYSSPSILYDGFNNESSLSFNHNLSQLGAPISSIMMNIKDVGSPLHDRNIVLSSPNPIYWNLVRSVVSIQSLPGDCNSSSSGAFSLVLRQEDPFRPGYFFNIEVYGSISNATTALLNSAACCLKLCNTQEQTIAKTPKEDCLDWVSHLVFFNAKLRYENYLKAELQKFKKEYYEKCLSAQSSEVFNMKFKLNSYHYTLYYYDQVGNLSMTVPPNGVHPFISNTDLQAVKIARQAKTEFVPPHRYETQYTYSSLNNLIWQKTPDAGVSNFYYDRLNRIIISQNAQQSSDQKYSYTVYDPLNRITEVGQCKNTLVSVTQEYLFNNTNLTNWFANIFQREQITKTYYDDDPTIVGILPGQFRTNAYRNLRNRVALSTFQDYEGANYDQASRYCYDITGNVSKLLREIVNLEILEQEYKMIDYEYDLISGKVNRVIYQKSHSDQYIHQYEYDESNRLKAVYTGQFEGLLREEKDVSYKYYKHGPLGRMELGALKVQGLDYAYTINGWLKSVNGSMADKNHDMGSDGIGAVGGIGSTFTPDQMAFVLSYFDQDYFSAKAFSGSTNPIGSMSNSGFGSAASSLFNGNIKSMEVSIAQFGSNPIGYAYSYDQLNRIIDAKAWNNYNRTTHSWQSGGAALTTYSNHFTYDGNGNILTQFRNGSGSNTAMDNLSYVYDVNPSSDPTLEKYTNKLIRVDDGQTNNAAYLDDIDDQNGVNYTYDKIGNLISDVSEEIGEIKWNVYGKISRIIRVLGSTKPDLEFHYSPDGHRTVKIVIPKNESESNQYTYYVRDAQGNVMATYSRNYSRVIDFDNLTYNDINNKLVELTNSSVFGNFIGKGVHNESTDLADELMDKVVVSSTAMADEVFNITSPLNYLKYSGELPNILTNIEIQSRGEIYYSILESTGAPFSMLENYCLNNNAFIKICESSLSSDGVHFLLAYNMTQQSDFHNMMITFEPGAINWNVEDQIAILLANHTQSDLANFIANIGNGNCNTLKTYFQFLRKENSALIIGNYDFAGNYLVFELGEPSMGEAVLNYGVPSQIKGAIDNAAGKSNFLDWVYTNDKNEFNSRCAQVSPAAVSFWQNNHGSLGYNKQQYFELVKEHISAQIYDNLSNYFVSNSNTYADSLNLKEWHLYGSSRIGIYQTNINMSYVLFDSEPEQLNGPHSNYRSVVLALFNENYYQLQRGNKRYELSNHLGNVLTVVSDKKISTCSNGQITSLSADVISATDYSPFGAPLAGRTYQSSSYRFAFNGMEKTDEVYGIGNEYTTEFRQYEPRLGRWMSLDPEMAKYSSQTPFNFCFNNPILYNDPFGDDPPERLSLGKRIWNGITGKGYENRANKYAVENKIDVEKIHVDKGSREVRIDNSHYEFKRKENEDGKPFWEATLVEEDIVFGRSSKAKEAGSAALVMLVLPEVTGTKVASLFFAATATYLVLNPPPPIIIPHPGLPRIIYYTPPPKTLPGFPDATRVPNKGRARWRDAEGDILEWDSQHGEVEVYDKRGKHKGVADPNTGGIIKPPVSGRTTRN